MKYFNPIEQYLDKTAISFTKVDLIKFFFETGKKMVNLLYIGDDSRIKTLTFIITSEQYLDTILTHGERIDGSSVFESVNASSSDLYILPVFKTAFVSPFAEIPTISFFCRIFEPNGQPFSNSIVNTLIKAKKQLKEKTGYDFRALGELEYYVISEEIPYYPMPEQKGYHTSTPFAKWANLRKEAMLLIAQAGGKIKYGHTEVGTFYYEDQYYEQHEIEFLPTDPEETAFQLMKAKWILRNLSEKYNVFISFAPKIAVGKAGSGLHFHFQLIKDGEDVMIKDRKLSDVAKKMIAGVLEISKSLSAFGNRIPISYLRLVPHQEAPTNICWGDRNRSVLIRVPLGWTVESNMSDIANQTPEGKYHAPANKQTIEIRSADNSANIFMMLAGLMIGAYRGLTDNKALEKAEAFYSGDNVFDSEHNFDQLPASCVEAAKALEEQRHIFEENNIFSKKMIDTTIDKLKSFNDKGLSEMLYGNQNQEALRELVENYIYCG